MTTRWLGCSFVAHVWVKRSCESAIMVVLVSLGACAQKPSGDSDEAVSARQNALIEAPISQFALLARHGMIFKDRVYEIGGNIGIAAGGSPLNTVNIGSDARVAIGKIIASPHVILAPRTVVGEVDATQVEATGATIAKRMPFVAPPPIPVPGPIAAGTVPVTIAMGQNQTLSAGKFGAVEVVSQGTLTLSGGIYQFASLKLGELSRVVAKGSTIVKVAGTVVAANRVQLAPVAPLKARDLRFEIGGVTPGTSNGFTLGNDCTLTALVVAQRGVSIGDRLVASGAMAAEDVALGFDSKLTLDGGFGCAAQTDCSTGGVCTAGTCVDSPLIACQASNISRVPVDPGQPFDLATSSTRVYWTDTAAGAVKSATLTGTGIATLVTGHPGIGGLAVDSSFVYYTDVLEKSVSRIPISGGSAEVIAANQRMPRFLVSDGDSLYWTNQGTGNADGSVRRFTKSTGTLDAIADRQPGPFTLTSSGGRVSWSDVSSGSVLTRSALTAPIEVIASGLRQPAISGSSATPHLLSADGRLYDFDAAAQAPLPRAIFAGGAFSLAVSEPSLFWTNGVQQVVSRQSSASEYSSTIWRRPGMGAPRVIRSSGGAIWFSVSATAPSGSIFTFTPDAATPVDAGSPVCPPGGQGPTCDQTASSITPLLECVAETADHQLIAHFGFTNQDKQPHRVGVGSENQFDRPDPDACQPTTFMPGTRHDVFAVGFVEELTWVVGSRSVTASRSSPRCQAGAVRNTEVSP
jgi:hypothetical protein